ncbi:MAG: bifunctional ornithine acetyltransferase/N-acetylglutamate synthase [Firmicutes bacterium]|nr:bifunctional ornithine acetyltransferase/N-acetylglutamate synthase [Bacillota bacterium]
MELHIQFVPGGVCAPLGFKASGIRCGIRRGKTKKDLALIVSQAPSSAAAIYTTNLVQAAPIFVTRENLSDGCARALICNSGIANTAVSDGVEKARGMCAITAAALGIEPCDVIVASTGVIGQSLNLEPIEQGITQLVAELSPEGGSLAAEAIMTTDTVKKEAAVTFDVGGRPVTIGGICKGSGMINPNMATMLAFLTTDADIAPELLAKMLKEAADASFNRVSVDGDTSTNDMLSIMANGMSGVRIVDSGQWTVDSEADETTNYKLQITNTDGHAKEPVGGGPLDAPHQTANTCDGGAPNRSPPTGNNKPNPSAIPNSSFLIPNLVPASSNSYEKFQFALNALCMHLAKMLAKDGEGATKLVECNVCGAPDIEAARKAADAVINSPLVKTALFGCDANWGRILCAVGYAGAALDISKISIAFVSAAGKILVCKNGAGFEFSEEKALEILKCNEITVEVHLNQGGFAASAWGCDLSYDYVKINGDYRS